LNKKINIHKSTVDITLITKNPIVSKILYIIRYPSKWRLLFRAAAYVLLFDLAFVYLFPFLYMVITSLKSPEDLADFTVNWIPKGIYLGNYIIAFGLLEYLNRLKNSIIITSLSIIGHVLSCSLIGYGFARFKFAAKKIMFIMVIMTIIVPVEVIIIPMFMQYSNLGWLNSYRPLIIPTFFGFGLRDQLIVVKSFSKNI
jgi:multiple sugar transport system permease protein